jgi:hypothetical protein
MVLATCYFSRSQDYTALCNVAVSTRVSEVQAQIEAHLRQASRDEGKRTTRKTTISQPLQQGSLSMLGGGEAVPNIAARVADLNKKAAAVWQEISKGRHDAAEVLQDKLGLAPFRAHCVARWIYAYTRGRYGGDNGPDSLHLGKGAVDALARLDADAASSTKEAPEIRFKRLLPKLRGAVEAAAKKAGAEDVLNKLAALPPFYHARAQCFEHLLCEAGKVFAARGGGEHRGSPKPGYKDAYDAARFFWEDAACGGKSRKTIVISSDVGLGR